MVQIGEGILPCSEIYFASPSVKAKKLYYHVLCAGHFFCDEKYHLIRESYDSALVVYVKEGTFSFKNNEGEFVTAGKNEIVLIDCYKPHEYYTEDEVEFIWIHMAGVNTKELCGEILKTGKNIFRSKSNSVIVSILEILDALCGEKTFNEAELSAEVYKILMELSEGDGMKSINEDGEDCVRIVSEYIYSHLGESITVSKLASLTHMSVTHFSRVFKQKTGFSPYDYVLAMRLTKAKELLLKTKKQIVEIAYETGFNSEANFIYCFSKNEGISPGKFRKLKF